MNQTLTALDFFAGSGLTTQGLKDFFRVIWANDICPKKAEVYLANHTAIKSTTVTSYEAKSMENGTKTFSLVDIATIEGKYFPKVSLSWASFPCQDLSLAGKLKGIDGERSGTVWHWLRIMEEMIERPDVLVAENVTGLLSSSNGKHYRALHVKLVERGYKVGPLVLNAASWLPHSRLRVFIVAVKDSVDITGLNLSEPDWPHTTSAIKASQGLDNLVWWKLPKPKKRSKNLADIIEFDAPVENLKASQKTLRLIPKSHKDKLDKTINQLRAIPGYKRTREQQVLELRFDGIAGCLRTPQGGSSRQWLILKPNGHYLSRLITVREAARLMGAPDSYLLPGGYNDGYRAMGDAVAVPVVRHLAKHLLIPLTRRTDA